MNLRSLARSLVFTVIYHDDKSRDAKGHRTQQYVCLIASPLNIIKLICFATALCTQLAKTRVSCPRVRQMRYFYAKWQEIQILPMVTQLIKERRQPWNSKFPRFSLCSLCRLMQELQSQSSLFLFCCHLETIGFLSTEAP